LATGGLLLEKRCLVPDAFKAGLTKEWSDALLYPLSYAGEPAMGLEPTTDVLRPTVNPGRPSLASSSLEEGN
jgi:hypothetical protein